MYFPAKACKIAMDVSVIIRTRNEAASIGRTLRMVGEQSFDGNYEIIVLDSGSTDSTLNIIKEYDVRLIQIPQREFTFGRSLNLGAIHARGEFLVNLSAHAFPRDKTWLAKLIREFEDANVAGVYGRQLSNGRINPFHAQQSDSFFGSERIIFNINDSKRLREVHFSNSNSAIRKEIWRRFGFDESVPYAEDVLWQRDVVEAGYSIAYVPNAAVYHTHKVSINSEYRNSRDCAYTLALMKRKRQSVPLVIFDVGIFFGLIPTSMLQSIWYMWRNNYFEYVKIAPLFVLSGWLGWLVGRMEYRLKK